MTSYGEQNSPGRTCFCPFKCIVLLYCKYNKINDSEIILIELISPVRSRFFGPIGCDRSLSFKVENPLHGSPVRLVRIRSGSNSARCLRSSFCTTPTRHIFFFHGMNQCYVAL